MRARILFLTIVLCGCATHKPSQHQVIQPLDTSQQIERVNAPDKIPETARKITKQKKVPRETLGLVFAKTHFEGVVKASYVSLTIESQSDKNQVYQLYIGEKSRQQSFPWKVQKVRPGYFFIELPEGTYRFSEIMIPVGTTTATEPMNVHFAVKANVANYIGTLNITGTKERIKLGGIPVIKPGFDYQVEVKDEFGEAQSQLKARLPRWEKAVIALLMQVRE